MDKLILIDGSGLIYRGFYAIPPFLKSPAGIQTNAVFGFTNILMSLLTRQKPQYMAVAFDRKGPTFRHKAFEAYKATRIKAPQELYDQIPLVKKVVSTFGVPSFEVEGFEADDILATIVALLKRNPSTEILIATGDFDLFQLADEKVSIIYPEKGFKEADILTGHDVEKKYSLFPKQIPDFKGLAGDNSDNIPGVHGIGEKGAKKLLAEYQTLENIYQHLDAVPEALRKKLTDGRESAFLSRNLSQLRIDTPVNFDLEACRVKNFNERSAREIFAELGFKSLLKKLDELYGTEQKQASLF